jgi:putative membrane protein
MSRLIVRLVINAVALWVAASLIDGIQLTDNVVGLVVIALVFGVVNALIRPIVTALTCPLNLLTLGLFTLVINALMLMLTAWLVGEGLGVASFWAALLGGIVIGIVSLVLSWFLSD